ncbi:DnaB-like helicase C-terminal domain-containing protein [Rhizobium beringeri]
MREIAQITTGPQGARRELNVPIIALSRLSRQVEVATTSGRSCPTFVNPGSIEQDADVVLFVFREEYYVKNSEPRDIHDPKYPKWERRSTR